MGVSIYGRTLNGRFITYKGKSENNMDDLGVALFLGTPPYHHESLLTINRH